MGANVREEVKHAKSDVVTDLLLLTLLLGGTRKNKNKTKTKGQAIKKS